MPMQLAVRSPQVDSPYQSLVFDSSAILDLLPFRPGKIEGVIWQSLAAHRDERGWLVELFRQDEMAAEVLPAMAYLSETSAGQTRGPHEHLQQTDHFCFIGSTTFHLYLWDNRQESPTYLFHEVAILPAGRAMSVVVPPGVVHAYRNVGAMPGLVANCPNRLYRGEGRGDPVDEIRHEDDPATVFRLVDVR